MMQYDSVVIYDLDGTLVDTARIVTEILNQMREQDNRAHLRLENVRPLTTNGGAEMIRIALNCPSNKVTEKLGEFRERYKLKETSEALVFPGVKSVLRRLKREGVSLAICTNKPKSLAVKTLKETKLYDFFDLGVYYDELGRNKPHPDPLFKIIDYFGLPKSAFVFIGDTKTDLLAATRAGLRFIFFDSGYDPQMTSRMGLEIISHHPTIFSKI